MNICPIAKSARRLGFTILHLIAAVPRPISTGVSHTLFQPRPSSLASTDPGHNRNHYPPVTGCAFKPAPWDEEWLRNHPPEWHEDGPYAFLRYVQRYRFRSHWKRVHPKFSSD